MIPITPAPAAIQNTIVLFLVLISDLPNIEGERSGTRRQRVLRIEKPSAGSRYDSTLLFDLLFIVRAIPLLVSAIIP